MMVSDDRFGHRKRNWLEHIAHGMALLDECALIWAKELKAVCEDMCHMRMR